ncbi:MAG TPA: hypothetical protein VFW03_26545 [Gemmatimonadaceae bacterium]|nr:hypothetical protein [Gemmatimonadaceae bacterium]
MNYRKSKVGRASAVLTTGEVAGAALDLDQAKDKQVVVDLSFTIGMLTNVTARFYGSVDGTTYDLLGHLAVPGTASVVLTADTEKMFIMPALPGIKWFRVSVQGSGTVTNSLCQFTYRYDKRGSL